MLKILILDKVLENPCGKCDSCDIWKDTNCKCYEDSIFYQGQQSIISTAKEVANECIHCHNKAYFIFLGAEPTSLCVECTGKFINKGLPMLEKAFQKILKFSQEQIKQEGKDGKGVQ
jgi:hypothetical protein